jgi:tRNA threonylcarbamoyladenosine biosynthesis protein TsaB
VRVLALDTATEACSVALLSGDGTALADALIIGRYEEMGKSNGLKVLGMIHAVLAEAQVSLSMLDGIAASVGPGAFTGVRISVAVAQGLAFGAGLPVVPVTTLEALALKAVLQGAQRVLACLDARMGEVYWGCFAADSARGVIAQGLPGVGPPQSVLTPEDGIYKGIGRGFSAYALLASLPGLQLDPASSGALPNAREIARLGALRLRAGEGLDPAGLQPLYLRDKVAFTEAERRGVKSP